MLLDPPLQRFHQKGGHDLAFDFFLFFWVCLFVRLLLGFFPSSSQQEDLVIENWIFGHEIKVLYKSFIIIRVHEIQDNGHSRPLQLGCVKENG